MLTSGRADRMKDIKASCAIAAKLDEASTTHRRQVGVDPSKDRLKELVWQILEPETLSRFSERGLETERVSYEELTEASKTRLNFLHQGNAALALAVIMGGVSILEDRPTEQGDNATSVQAKSNENEPRPNSEVDTG